MEYGKHYSVLFNECINFFVENKNTKSQNFADLTFGAGGHTFGIANAVPGATLYSVDQDPDAIKNGLEKIKELGFEEKVFLNKMNFEEFPKWFEENHSDKKLSGVLLDLGVSSHQFDTNERGFSFQGEGKLDMRMAYDNDSINAYDVINTYAENDIADILYKYGEERLSRRIAKLIVEKREEKPIESTLELENIIFHAYPSNQRHKKPHPATRSFQALRIYVNRELEVLENVLENLYNLLEEDGLLLVISFHSLEDRIVKHKFKEIVQKYENLARILSKKPILPTQEELEENSRSRSAKLRVLQKTTFMKESKYGQRKKKQYI